ncbi:glycoside hydrolase, partial [Chaetomium fimeti]
FFPYYPADGQSSIQRHWVDFSPIVDITSPALVCNNPGSYAEEYATVDAGAEIKAYYPGWPHDIGAVVVWMAYCGAEPAACSSFNGTGRHWFKIDQAGLLSGSMREGLWAQKQLMANNFTWGATIPETLRGGAYLLRHELIALHVPFSPEFYPECAHLHVLSSGDGVPGEEYLASIPGVWEEDGE